MCPARDRCRSPYTTVLQGQKVPPTSIRHSGTFDNCSLIDKTVECKCCRFYFSMRVDGTQYLKVDRSISETRCPCSNSVHIVMSQQMQESNSASTKRKRQPESTTNSRTFARKSRKVSAESSPAPDAGSQDEESPKPTSKHTKKERKQNRSTRIHSLRKQLARGTLPSTIQQEKERELEALLHEQTKTASKQQAKKTLEKYHYVRFLERRKAEKKLKQLRKQQDAHGESDDLSKRIHEMEVSRNYAIYAPLGEKYVSIFVAGGEVDTKDSNTHGKRPPKPTMWYTVETAMLGGEAGLEALREGKNKVVAQAESDEEMTSQTRKAVPAKSNKVSSSREATRDRNDTKRKVTFQVEEEAEQSSDDDDIDGGFFER